MHRAAWISPQAALFDVCRFLNERMVFGQAPDDLLGVFAQRLRWAMGALQVSAAGSRMGCSFMAMDMSRVLFSAEFKFLQALSRRWLGVV